MSLSKPKPEFRFMDLPEIVKRNTVSTMTMSEQIAYSFCSKKSARLLKTISLNRAKLEVRIEYPTININFRHNTSNCLVLEVEREFQEIREPIEVPVPISAIGYGESSNKTTSVSLNEPQWNVNQWIKYLVEIFRMENIKIHFTGHAVCYHIECIKKMLDGIPFDELCILNCGIVYTASVIEEYTSKLKIIQFDRILYPDSRLEWKEKMLDKEWIHFIYTGSCSTTMRDLLDCKALNVDIFKTVMTVHDLNAYLKLWMNGKANLTIESLLIRIKTQAIETFVPRVLQGIKHTERPQTLERKFYRKDLEPTFHRSENGYNNGGYDVERSDGKKATLFLDDRRWKMVVNCTFIVWP